MRQFFRNLLNPLMVLTMIAVVSAIAAFLPNAQVHWKTTYAAIVIIAVLGSAAVVYQMWGLYYRATTVKQIQWGISRRPTTCSSRWRRPSGTLA